MEWTEILVGVSSADADTAAAVVSMVCHHGIYIEDYSDMEETLPKIGWVDAVDEELLAKDRQKAFIHIYLPKNENPTEAAAFITERLTAENVAHTVSSASVDEEVWANNWKKYYKPEHVGKNLVVCPSWERYEPQQGDVIIDLDPGSAFGTGQHETTRLCLELLESAVAAGDKILDVGCGSGILSIAALKLGAQNAAVVDIDKNAVKTAADNALANGFDAGIYRAFSGNILTDPVLCGEIGTGFDIIAANIVADIIIEMKEIFFRKLSKGGALIVSGIIDTRAQEVEDALVAAGFKAAKKRELRGWVAIILKKM